MEPFEQVLRAAVREVFPGMESVYSESDPTYVKVLRPEGELAIRCSEIERTSRGEPFDERVRLTIDYLRLFAAPQEDFDSPPWERLQILVRPSSILQRRAAFTSAIYRGIGNHLVEMLAVDYPKITNVLSDSTVDKWEVPVAELWGAARANLHRCEIRTEILPIGATGEGAAFVVEPYGYEASILTRPLLFNQPIPAIANPVEGLSRPVVFVPRRNEAFILPEADETAIDKALQYVAEVFWDDPRAVVPAAFVVENGTFVPWREPGNRLAERSWLQWRWFVRNEYREQGKFLSEDPVFANHLANTGLRVVPVQGSAQQPTFAVVEPGEEELMLPEVEYLDIRHDLGYGRDRVVVPWEQAQEILPLELSTDDTPTRWILRSRPDDATWQLLRERRAAASILDAEE